MGKAHEIRERREQVMKLSAAGRKTSEIAERLGVSRTTICSDKAANRGMLGVRERREQVMMLTIAGRTGEEIAERLNVSTSTIRDDKAANRKWLTEQTETRIEDLQAFTARARQVVAVLAPEADTVDLEYAEAWIGLVERVVRLESGELHGRIHNGADPTTEHMAKVLAEKRLHAAALQPGEPTSHSPPNVPKKERKHRSPERGADSRPPEPLGVHT